MNIILFAHLIDGILGDAHYFRDAVVFFYPANELLSIIENMKSLPKNSQQTAAADQENTVELLHNLLAGPVKELEAKNSVTVPVASEFQKQAASSKEARPS